VGIIGVEEALARATNQSIDLVLVSNTDILPVCKLMDYSKYLYEQEKKAKKQHKRKIHTKEYNFKPSTDYHDIDVMVKKCLKNLEKGHRILFSVRFSKREQHLKGLGLDKLKYVEQELKDIAVLEKQNKEPMSISFLFINKPKD